MSDDVHIHSEDCTANYLAAARAYATSILSDSEQSAVATEIDDLLKQKDFAAVFENLEKAALDKEFEHYEFWRLMEVAADSMSLADSAERCKAKMHESSPLAKDAETRSS